jgi:multidrug resistance efflux pump
MRNRRRLVIALVLIGGIAAAWVATRQPAAPRVGMVRATEIRIAPEIGGRLGEIVVKPGAGVRAGDVLARLEIPELAAAVVEARATAAEARAERDRVYAGPRREQIDILAREIDKAAATVTLAEQHYERVATLAARQFASRQDRDQAAAEVAETRSALAAARSRHSEAKAGPTAEDRAIATAKVAAADAAVVVMERRLDKAVLRAPVDGTVRVIAAESGEALVSGRAVLTLEPADGTWFSVVLREDELGERMRVGAALTLATADGKTVTARVTEIRGLGEFATWRAARAVGDHDLNGFSVRIDPVDRRADLPPGMTVWISSDW